MRYQIDEKDLDALLARRASYIGAKNVSAFDLINGCIVTLTALTSNYFPTHTAWNIALKTLFFILGVTSILMELRVAFQKARNKYTVDQMKSDIAGLNKIQKNYSIIAIKDRFTSHPDRFLQYFDEGWKCWFFPNYPTMNSDNERHISDRLRNELGLDGNISVNFRGSWSDDKFSTEHHEWRTYNHELYEANVESFPESEQHAEFCRNGRQYRWMTLSEMTQDSEIQKHNMDVVTRVREHID